MKSLASRAHGLAQQLWLEAPVAPGPERNRNHVDVAVGTAQGWQNPPSAFEGTPRQGIATESRSVRWPTERSRRIGSNGSEGFPAA